jgi:hypothetical protein
LAKIINDNKRIGIACAVPKKAYDDVLPDDLKEIYGKEHYTFAVRMCLNLILEWREKSLIRLPMQYIFDFETKHSEKRIEIEQMFDTLHDSWREKFGIEGTGYAFQPKKEFKPLQAADILAWQMNNLMRKIPPDGEETEGMAHPNFMKLRTDQEMDLGFFTHSQLEKWVKRNLEFKAKSGMYF